MKTACGLKKQLAVAGLQRTVEHNTTVDSWILAPYDVKIKPSRAADAVAKISPGAMGKLFAEIRRIKKRYGSWTLVEVNSASGAQVLITL